MENHAPALSRHSFSGGGNLAALRTLGYTVLTIWECQLKTILTQGGIPNLPPKAEAVLPPTYSPRPDTTLTAAAVLLN